LCLAVLLFVAQDEGEKAAGEKLQELTKVAGEGAELVSRLRKQLKDADAALLKFQVGFPSSRQSSPLLTGIVPPLSYSDGQAPPQLPPREDPDIRHTNKRPLPNVQSPCHPVLCLFSTPLLLFFQLLSSPRRLNSLRRSRHGWG
jgi:hypothetical protein